MFKKITEITIESRLRQNMGDLNGLIESLKTYGQIQPIVLDENDILIAGGRRLTAAQMLGWKEIEVVYLRDLDPQTKRMIELEENIRREPLTEYEKSERLTQLLGAAKEVLRGKEEANRNDESNKRTGLDPTTEMEEVSMTRGVIDKNSNSRGPKAKSDSIVNVSALTGVPRQTFTEAKQHMEAVQEVPALKDQPKKAVVQVARELKKIDDPETKEAYKTALAQNPDVVQITAKPEQVLELHRDKEALERQHAYRKGILDAMAAVRKLPVKTEEELTAAFESYLELEPTRYGVELWLEQLQRAEWVFRGLTERLNRRLKKGLEAIK